MTDHETFARRLAEFQAATHALSEAWNGFEVEEYPGYLPSFDEFAADFSAVHAAPEIKGTAHPLDAQKPLEAGDVVFHQDSANAPDQRAVVVTVHRDGRVDLIAPGPEGVGIEFIDGVSCTGDLMVTGFQPLPAVEAKAEQYMGHGLNEVREN